MNARQCATLPRKMPIGSKLPAPMPPRRDPKTTLSVGRARAKSMVAGLEGGNSAISCIKINFICDSIKRTIH